MTMLEAGDGDQRSSLDIADVIARVSPQATQDLHELWRRVAFSIEISNTDDHLRNHGFVRTTTAGWSLSPAFDINPNPRGAGTLSTTIDFDDPTASVELLRSVAGEFRLSLSAADRVIADVRRAASTWREVAAAEGLGRAEMEEMAAAFSEGPSGITNR